MKRGHVFLEGDSPCWARKVLFAHVASVKNATEALLSDGRAKKSFKALSPFATSFDVLKRLSDPSTCRPKRTQEDLSQQQQGLAFFVLVRSSLLQTREKSARVKSEVSRRRKNNLSLSANRRTLSRCCCCFCPSVLHDCSSAPFPSKQRPRQAAGRAFSPARANVAALE